MEQVALAELILDFENLYPRASVDSTHVSHMIDAMVAGLTLPPIVIDKKTRKVIDGFHRYSAAKRLKAKTISAEVRDYDTPAAMFMDAMHLNSGHGRAMSNFDRAHCVIMAARLKLEPEQIATALAITVEKVGELRVDRIGRMRNGTAGQAVPLKRTIHHMAGQSLSKSQVEAQVKLGGMDQAFYVNQVIVLIENNLLDTGNDKLMAMLHRLADLLNALPDSKAA